MEKFVFKNNRKLRKGITTGTCAAAAAKGAALLLLFDIRSECVKVTLPEGEKVNIQLKSLSKQGNTAICTVVKDSGDDPDVTDRAEIEANVKICDTVPETAFNKGNIYIEGGKGVGRVTKKGLEQNIGQAAINKVPREMIYKAVEDVCCRADIKDRLIVTISVPQGEKIALDTFNEKLGIKGGISILGTKGIVEPMSERAIIDTIEAEIRQLSLNGVKDIVITPGNYGERYVKEYLKYPVESVKCSNFIGETLDIAVFYGVKDIVFAGNMGKLVKVAGGIMNTHSKTADGRGEIFALYALLAGAERKTAIEILNCINTDEMLDICSKAGVMEAVVESIIDKIYDKMRERVKYKVGIRLMVFSERYGLLGIRG